MKKPISNAPTADELKERELRRQEQLVKMAGLQESLQDRSVKPESEIPPAGIAQPESAFGGAQAASNEAVQDAQSPTPLRTKASTSPKKVADLIGQNAALAPKLAELVDFQADRKSTRLNSSHLGI